MITFLSILGILIFLAGAYFMGNFFLDTFDHDLRERIMASLYGVLCWFGVGVVAAICYVIVLGVQDIFK
jgi:drug/metabolite transporter (DMT)-like permease